MKATKRKRLEAAGFRIGDAEDFLELTPEERELVDLRVKLSRLVRTLREQQHLTQEQLATKINSSQSRVAKLESGVGGISLDLMFRGFFAVGGKLTDVTGALEDKASSGKSRTPSKRTRGGATV